MVSERYRRMPIDCPMCNGQGFIDIRCRCWGLSPQYHCPRCSNTGIAETIRCDACGGAGKVYGYRINPSPITINQ